MTDARAVGAVAGGAAATALFPAGGPLAASVGGFVGGLVGGAVADVGAALFGANPPDLGDQLDVPALRAIAGLTGHPGETEAFIRSRIVGSAEWARIAPAWGVVANAYIRRRVPSAVALWRTSGPGAGQIDLAVLSALLQSAITNPNRIRAGGVYEAGTSLVVATAIIARRLAATKGTTT